jgi:hypothetical protein
MDEQTPSQTDLLPTQLAVEPPKKRTTRPKQVKPANEASAAPSSQLLPTEQRVRQTQPPTTRQVPAPQPILFPEMEVSIQETIEVPLPVLPPPTRPQRLAKVRRLLRSRLARVLLPLCALLIGLALGLGSIVWYGLEVSNSAEPLSSSTAGNLIIEANQAFVQQLVRNDMTNAGLPGQVEHVSVTLATGDMLTIQGDDVYSFFGLSLTRHFVLQVQPYVQQCLLQVKVTHADLGGIPVTGFVQTFDGKINQQLGKKPAGLPSDFNYCTVGVRTEPAGMFITYEAIAVSATPNK